MLYFFNSVESNAYIEEVIVESNYGDYWDLMQYSNNLIDTMDHITVDQTDIDYADLKEEICDLETQAERHFCRAEVLLSAAQEVSACTNIPLSAEVEIGIDAGIANLSFRVSGNGQDYLENCRFEIDLITQANLETCEGVYLLDSIACVY